jgi:hypothetical protein
MRTDKETERMVGVQEFHSTRVNRPKVVAVQQELDNTYPQSVPPSKFLPFIYRMSQEECARLQEGVPYVKIY